MLAPLHPMEDQMKTFATLAVLLCGLLPGLAVAECRGDKATETSASCAPGMIWDEASATCIAASTS